MRIDELFGSPYPFFQAVKTKEVWKYAFETTGKVKYTVVAEMHKPGLAELGFIAQAPGEKFTLKATGTGDAPKVLVTIKAIVQQFIKQYVADKTKGNGKPPRIISFSGALDEPTRLKLYDRLARSSDSWMPPSNYNYKLHRTAEKDGYKVYVLVRTDLLD